MSQDPIREAFQKAKQDVIDLKALIISLQNEISQLKSSINELQSHQNQESNTPTHQQTNQQTHNSSYFSQKIPSEVPKLSPSDRLIQVSEALSSLDSIKRELYHQIKRLTNQEMLIFSTIYQLQEEGFTVDYSILASKLSLSESSIREYTLKLIAKGIPIAKSKVNNKKIILSIPENLKKLASLTTILALREI